MTFELSSLSPRLLMRQAWRAGLAACVAVSLAACGGGGGTAPTDPATPSVGGTPPEVPEPVPTRPTGWLWHDNYALDFAQGIQMASLDGQGPQQITASKLALSPWPDGRQYVTTEWNAAGKYTDLLVRDRASGNTLHALRANGYLRAAQPSPTDKRLVVRIQPPLNRHMRTPSQVDDQQRHYGA